MDKVSIIIPCFKQAEFLSETLDSVLAQTYSDWECIIVNDGSPDNTEEIVKLYKAKDHRFKYLFQENQGPSAARNAGILSSKGNYILPLDADDLIEPSYIEKAIGRFVNYPETKLVYCKADRFGAVNEPWVLEDYNYESFIWNNCIFCSAIYRRDDYNKTNGYNVNMVHGNEDWDFWLSLLKKEDVVFQLDEILFHYRIKANSRTTDLAENHEEESFIQICKNHFDIYHTFADRVLLYNKELQKISMLQQELERVYASKAYRLGKFLLKPFSWVR